MMLHELNTKIKSTMTQSDNFINEFLENHTVNVPANIVILTGAGISAESGLQTFRGDGGLWCGHRVEDVATPEAFARNPDLVHQFYNERREGLLEEGVKPNSAHTALADLQKDWGGEVTIVTQNIDDLHERGGASDVIHMHGEILKSFCIHCGAKCAQIQNSGTDDTCTNCGRTGGMRPDIVWFGEMPYHMDVIENKIANADLFLSIGTSGNVYPAAGFVRMADYVGAKTVEINLEPPKNAHDFTHGLYGMAGTEVPKFVAQILEHKEKG